MKRPLSTFERSEASFVFGGSIIYERVVVVEGAGWPDTLARLSARISGAQPPSHNAITLGNHIYFPVQLRTGAQPLDPEGTSDMAWLVHELTHVWQYQHSGPIYLGQALWAQIRLGPQAYSYGWEQGLRQALQDGLSLSDFNREQQGEIARHFYFRSRQAQDVSAWEPFVAQFQLSV
jgi:hypothetical protein